MKIIDDKGRIFGYINILDLFILLIMLGITVGGIGIAMSDTTDKNSTPSTKIDTVQITVKVHGTEPYVARGIPVNATTEGGKIHIKAKDIQPYNVVIKSESGELKSQVHPRKKSVIITATVQVTKDEQKILFRGSPLRIGRKVSIVMSEVAVTGQVIDINQTNASV